jgi:hypothetical protein
MSDADVLAAEENSTTDKQASVMEVCALFFIGLQRSQLRAEQASSLPTHEIETCDVWTTHTFLDFHHRPPRMWWPGMPPGPYRSMWPPPRPPIMGPGPPIMGPLLL